MKKNYFLKNSIAIVGIILLAFSSLSSAQIYKSVDANGTVTFSDTPPPGQEATAEAIPPPAQINSIPGVSIETASSMEDAVETPLTERRLEITSPSDNTTIPMGAGIFDVRVTASPRLIEGEIVELYLDEEKVDDGEVPLQWTLRYVLRGEHVLQAKWIDQSGAVLSVSDPVTVFVLRPSIL